MEKTGTDIDFKNMPKSAYIELNEGVGRVNGNASLYVRLLNSFKGDTKIDEFMALMEAGDFDKAKVIAHTIKGVTANLSLKELCRHMTYLEQILKNGKGTEISRDELNDVRECTEITLQHIESAISSIQK